MRVLVVDDEPRLAAAVQRGLEAEGFAVDTASPGEGGRWMPTEVPYDVIVLDIMLPGMSGYAVCSHLREAGVWTPTLMLTAKDGEWDEAEALDTGADGYLSKPFSFVVLVAHIRALLRRGAVERPTKLSVGDLVVDPAPHSCDRGDTNIELTAKEFSVLEFLLRSQGDVVTKSRIAEHVWDAAYDGDLNVVEVHISALRRKIDAPFGTDTIRTIRGAGYQLAGQ